MYRNVLHVLPPLVPLRRLWPAVTAALFEAPTPPAHQKRGPICVDSPAVRGAGLGRQVIGTLIYLEPG
jgi:hypothetical protein